MEHDKIQILYILPLGGIGGAEKFVLSLCRHHDRSRFEVKVCVLFSRGPVSEEISSLGHEVIYLDMPHGFDVIRARRLIPIIRGRKIDVVNIHGQNPLAKLCAVLSRCPVLIHTDHGTTLGSPTRRKRRVVFMNRLLTPFFHRFVAISKGMRQSLVRRERVPEEEITLIYNGIDVETFSLPRGRGDALRQALSLPAGVPVLGTIGRLSPEKQIPLLFRSLSHLKEEGIAFVSLIVGDGPQRDELEALSKDMGLESVVRFLGNRDDVPDLLEIMDLFLFPSGGEAFSIVLLEVMAKALPIVAFEVEGVNEAVVSGETGLLVPFGDVEGFAKGVRSLLESPALLRRMGGTALDRVKSNFDLRDTVRKTETMYQELLGGVHGQE
jgi:glycosyltransferase involved in cell wall biosynthesis